MKNYKIIDSHCHIYPDKIAQRAVNGTDSFYSLESVYDGKLSTLLSSGAKHGVSQFVVQSVATTPAQVGSINKFIADEVCRHDNLIGLGTLHPDSADIKGDVEQIIQLGLRGVKLHPDIQRFKTDDYRCLKIYELCEGRLPILIHAGDSRYDFSNPNRFEPILEIYNSLTVIGAHLGGWSVWDEAVEKLSRFDNFYVDTSSSFAFLDRKKAKKIIRTYGADRVLFGSDYPMWSVGEELEYLFSLGLEDSEYEKILHGNAEKLYGI